MHRTLVAVALLAHSMILPVAGCTWWQSKGKAEAQSALACAEAAMAREVAVLIAKVAMRDYAALSFVGEDVIACAIAAVSQMPTPPAAKTTPAEALRVELAARKVRR